MDIDDIKCLSYFEYNIEGETFREYFVESGGTKNMAEHIWDKFHGYQHSFLKTFGMADSANKRLLFKVATKWCKENDYPVTVHMVEGK